MLLLITRTVLISVISAFSLMHPYYLSVTELAYNAKERSFQGSVKMYVSDLETALKKISGRTVDLINSPDNENNRKLIESYLTKRLTIKVDGSLKNYTVIGYEHEGENILAYFEIKDCKTVKSLTIINSVLYDYIKQQINIIHVEVRGIKKSIKLVNPEKSATFLF
jgi:hypothetical protein